MNIPLTAKQVRELPLGLTNSIGPNRKQRRQRFQKDIFVKPSKNYPLVVNRIGDYSFSKCLRISQFIPSKIVQNEIDFRIVEKVIPSKTIYHYKIVK